MKHLSSAQNPIIKSLRALKSQAKVRRDQAQTIIEGVHLVESYLDANRIPKLCVISENAADNKEVSTVLDRCLSQGVSIISISESQYKTISSVDSGVGIVCVIDVPMSLAESRLTEDAVLIDEIQDPGNLGTIFRTVAAAGLKSVYCSQGSTSAWSPKTLRAGMGAHFVLNIYENCDLGEIIDQSKIPILATTLGAKTSIYETDLSNPNAWLMGNEGQGISERLLSKSVRKVSVPQSSGVESMNVASAAAVCLFEQYRQRLS